MRSGTIVLVEDDELFARVLTRFFTRYGAVRVARSLEAARELFDEIDAPMAMVFDVSLPDGSGLDALEHARTHFPSAPAMMLTGHVDADLINRAQRLRAEYAVKPVDPRNLEAFAQHAVASYVVAKPGRRVVQRWALRHRLSPRETQIVAVTFSGTPREDLSRVLGLSENTVKTHVRRMLKKCKVRDLDALTQRLLKEGMDPS
jgi:DNA-binding NarL/FixJ family response regulator